MTKNIILNSLLSVLSTICILLGILLITNVRKVVENIPINQTFFSVFLLLVGAFGLGYAIYKFIKK